MESWICRLLLMVSLVSVAPLSVAAESDNEEEESTVIEPEIKRSKLKVSEIDTENFEVGAFAGFMSVEDFGVNPSYGFTTSYHVTEDVFFQLSYGQTDTEETSFERLSGSAQLLTDEQRELSYYNLAIGWKILPGEAFVGRSVAFNTSFYALLGAGSTEFAGDDRFSLMFGGGYKILFTDFFSVHFDVRNHMFDLELLSEEQTITNMEFTIGVTGFF